MVTTINCIGVLRWSTVPHPYHNDLPQSTDGTGQEEDGVSMGLYGHTGLKSIEKMQVSAII